MTAKLMNVNSIVNKQGDVNAIHDEIPLHTSNGQESAGLSTCKAAGTLTTAGGGINTATGSLETRKALSSMHTHCKSTNLLLCFYPADNCTYVAAPM